MTYKPFDVVVVPFPFTDQDRQKRRPALVLSSEGRFNAIIGHMVLAMITSAKNAPWPLDSKITDLQAAGLTAESVVRLKLFTLDERLVLNTIGQLAKKDRRRVRKNLKVLLPL